MSVYLLWGAGLSTVQVGDFEAAGRGQKTGTLPVTSLGTPVTSVTVAKSGYFLADHSSKVGIAPKSVPSEWPRGPRASRDPLLVPKKW